MNEEDSAVERKVEKVKRERKATPATMAKLLRRHIAEVNKLVHCLKSTGAEVAVELDDAGAMRVGEIKLTASL